MFNPEEFDYEKFREFLIAKGFRENGVSEITERLKTNQWDRTDMYEVESFMQNENPDFIF